MDTGVVTDQWYNPYDPDDIQTLQYPTSQSSQYPIKRFFFDEGPGLQPQAYKVPFGFVQKVNFTIVRFITLGEFYKQIHPEYLDDKGLTGVHELIQDWLQGSVNNPKGQIPEKLQRLWLMSELIWPK